VSLIIPKTLKPISCWISTSGISTAEEGRNESILCSLPLVVWNLGLVWVLLTDKDDCDLLSNFGLNLSMSVKVVGFNLVSEVLSNTSSPLFSSDSLTADSIRENIFDSLLNLTSFLVGCTFTSTSSVGKERYRKIIVIKARTMGYTWVKAFIKVFKLLYAEDYKSIITSRIVDDVDEVGDEEQTIMGRIRFIINHLPFAPGIKMEISVDKFLLLRSGTYWDFPQGNVEPGEKPIDAAVGGLRLRVAPQRGRHLKRDRVGASALVRMCRVLLRARPAVTEVPQPICDGRNTRI